MENKRLNEEIMRLRNDAQSPVPVIDNTKNEMFIETIKSLIDKVGQRPEKSEDEGLKR